MLPLVRASVSKVVSDAAQSDLERIRLAVTEACANVVRHAYPDDSGVLDVAVCLRPSVVMIDVRDCGVGVPDDPEPRTERSEERRVGKECRSLGSPYH